MDKETKKKLVEGFTGIGTGLVCDAMVLLGLPVRVVTGLHQMDEHQKPYAGFAVTLKQMERHQSETGYNLTRHGEVIDGMLEYGDVLVMDVNGRDDVCTSGGICATRAQARGCVGYVVNGCLRDIEEIAAIDFPVYYKGSHPVKSSPELQTVAINEPVEINKVQIRPGDMIVADRTGIVVFPADCAEKLLAKTQELKEYEDGVMESVKAGNHIIYDTENLKGK